MFCDVFCTAEEKHCFQMLLVLLSTSVKLLSCVGALRVHILKTVWISECSCAGAREQQIWSCVMAAMTSGWMLRVSQCVAVHKHLRVCLIWWQPRPSGLMKAVSGERNERVGEADS